MMNIWSKSGEMVRALASHQCGLGLNPGVNDVCGLSLLSVLSLAPRGFSLGTPVFRSPQRTPKCYCKNHKITNTTISYI